MFKNLLDSNLINYLTNFINLMQIGLLSWVVYYWVLVFQYNVSINLYNMKYIFILYKSIILKDIQKTDSL